MAPYISRGDDEGFLKPFPILHPGIGRVRSQPQIHQPHVFQQSVTLTATMWNENDSSENMENWNLGNWGIFPKYSPLFVGLFCGFGIVLIIMSTVMLWRYCFFSATKKVCCNGAYGEMTTQHQNSLPTLRKDKIENQNGFETFHNPVDKHSALQRSATVGSMAWDDTCTRTESKFSKLHTHGFPVHSTNLATTQIEPLMSQDNLYTSHLYLPKLEPSSPEMSKHLSQSTTALEDLYAKVNFSKKRKNRMRKDEAAIIAMSKSHSGQNNNSLELFGSAVVVYNERTAL